MEMLKEPRNALATANLIGLVGSTVYFYKQMEVFRADMVRLNDNLAKVVHKLAEVEKRDGSKVDTLRALSDQIKQLGERMEQVPSLRSVKNIENDLFEIVHSLEHKGFDIELSTPEPNTRRRGGYDSDAPESGSRRRGRDPSRERERDFKDRESREVREPREPRESLSGSSRYRDDTYRNRRSESFKDEPIDELLISEVRKQVN